MSDATTLKDRALVLMDQAHSSLIRGAVPLALQQIDQARQLALQTDDVRLQIDSLTRAAIVYSRARKLDIALSALEDAERIALSSNQENPVFTKLLTNKGALLADAGFLHLASKMLCRLLTLTDDSSDLHNRTHHLISLSNLVFICLATGRVRGALDRGEQFLSVFAKGDSGLTSENLVFFEGWYATALAQAGRHDEARQRLTKIRNQIPAEALGSQLQFSIALAITEVHGGFVDQGVTRLRDVVAQAKEKNLFYAQALHALTLVFEHLGRVDEALVCVEKLEAVMKEDARGIVGIEENDEERLFKEQQANLGKTAPERAGSADDEAQEDEAVEPTNSSIRMLDDRAAQLRIRRFMELAQDERASVLDSIAVASALVDDETGRHCARVERLTYEFCRALNFPERRARLVASAARMHDLGKVGIPHRVLLAPRRLTPMEFEIAKKHVPIGADLLSFSDHEVVKMAKIIAENHHERWDGSGYPKKKFEDAIPIEARITSIVDVFDVLTHRRVYKRAWSVQQARDEIEFMSGRNFDPSLVELFLKEVVGSDYVIPTEFPNERRSFFDSALPR